MKKGLIILTCMTSLSFCKAQSTDKTEPKSDTLQINKNDSRFFEAEPDFKNTLRLKEVPNILDSSKTLSIQLIYSDASGTMLKIFNPFS